MKNISKEQVAILNEKKSNIMNEINEFCEKIIEEKKDLAQIIIEQEDKLEHLKEVGFVCSANDIFNPENILEAGKKENPEVVQEQINLLYKGFAQNPFCDSIKTEKGNELLDSLEKILEEMDCFYDSAVIKTRKELEMAKANYNRALEEQTEYRRNILKDISCIGDACKYDVFGANRLRVHGASEIRNNPLFGMISCSMTGKEIVELLKEAIKKENANAKNKRKVSGKKRVKQPVMDSQLVEGEKFVIPFGHLTASSQMFTNPMKGLTGFFNK